MIKVRMSFKERDLGWSKVKKSVKDLAKKPHVEVGILEDAGMHKAKKGEEPVPLSLVATVHEFGAPGANIPERSFIRSTMDESGEKFQAMAASESQDMLLGKTTTEKALGRIGSAIQGAIQKKIADGDSHWPELKPATIAAKGSSRALIDTGQLRQSIRYKVKNSGGKSDQ